MLSILLVQYILFFTAYPNCLERKKTQEFSDPSPVKVLSLYHTVYIFYRFIIFQPNTTFSAMSCRENESPLE